MSEEIRQEVIIKAEPKDIFKELLIWGQAKWWPKDSLMEFKNLSGNICLGTRYLQKVKLPFAPSWYSENTAIDEDKFYLRRTFLSGIFEGWEEFKVVSQEGSQNKVEYCFNYKLRGVVNILIWKAVFRRMHMQNIEKTLKALKKYLEN